MRGREPIHFKCSPSLQSAAVKCAGCACITGFIERHCGSSAQAQRVSFFKTKLPEDQNAGLSAFRQECAFTLWDP